jgi:uncharacterized membrane protein YgdD (TMEM256/DUF423 family)
MGRGFVVAGSLLGAASVGMAAVAAHALSGRLDAAGLEAVRSAVQMQGWHALALVAAGLWLMRAPAGWARRLAALAGGGFLLGTLLFCGGIYVHHLAALPTGPLAPVGGVTLIISWLLLAASALLP